MRSLMPRSLARSSSRSVSGVAARRAAQSSRPIVRNRLSASITPRTLRSPRAPRCNPLATARPASGAATTRPRRGSSTLVVAEAIAVPRAGAGRGRRRPGVRRRPLPRRRGAARRASSAGRPRLVGCDIDAGGGRPRPARALRRRRHGRARRRPATRLGRRWHGGVDVVVGNPPYLSQLAAATTPRRRQPPRRRSVRRRRRRVPRPRPPPRRGPTAAASGSSCRSRSSPRATPRRCAPSSTRAAGIVWSWWSPEAVFDAQVLVCALVARDWRDAGAGDAQWTDVVTASARRCRRCRTLAAAGTLGDRCRLTANFRDQYYGLVPAVVDDGAGPPLVTSGLIDPATCRWGERPVTFARRRFAAPDRRARPAQPGDAALGRRLLVPKVLVANQTRVDRGRRRRRRRAGCRACRR